MIHNSGYKIVVWSLIGISKQFSSIYYFRQLTSPLKDHFASPPALANSHVKVTFLSFPSLANWSVRGCFHFCIKIRVNLSMHDSDSVSWKKVLWFKHNLTFSHWTFLFILNYDFHFCYFWCFYRLSRENNNTINVDC